MSKRNPKILIVATSQNTRGGITSVVKAHQQCSFWQQYKCKWLETHIDKGAVHKLLYFFKSFCTYLFILPFYDVVHIHTSEPPSALRKVPFMMLAKLFGKKTIVHFHSFSLETTINSKYNKVYKYLFQNADVTLVLSAYWKKEIEQTFQLGSKVSILYNPCSLADRTILYQRKKQILYAGTVNKRKGFTDLIRAFAKVSQNFPEWQIVFAGNGEIEQGELLAKELNIADQSIFLGWISGEAKSKAFQEASVFCLPSYAEGFPMAVLDAWAYDLPIITTPVGGLPDILVDGKNALVFEPGDVNLLAEQITRIIKDEALRASIEKESTKLAKTIFAQDVICNQLSIIYKVCLK